ncbi:hypothetical protein M0R45_008641 [Rubus argutus]|uniref:Uncharacterized protein n=1 Tax=Rubus argutus TaxID=59490 RepID=A0AAW1Y3I1_RUBAR
MTGARAGGSGRLQGENTGSVIEIGRVCVGFPTSARHWVASIGVDGLVGLAMKVHSMGLGDSSLSTCDARASLGLWRCAATEAIDCGDRTATTALGRARARISGQKATRLVLGLLRFEMARHQSLGYGFA